jgi:hypothetical protein
VGGGVVIAGVAIVVVSPQQGRPKAKKPADQMRSAG